MFVLSGLVVWHVYSNLLVIGFSYLTSRVEHKQKLQKQRYDQHTTVRQFVPDDAVYVRNFGEGDTWLAGTIVNAFGPCSYNVKLSDDRVVRRHADHIRFRCLPDQIFDTTSDGTIPFPTISDAVSPADNVVPSVPLRRSTRTSRPPDRLTYT